jgi:hypothetical protein
MPYALCLYTEGTEGAETCRREEVEEAQTGEALYQGTPFYLLYWYRSTNTDAEAQTGEALNQGTQFYLL